jgi:hypothetical protein
MANRGYEGVSIGCLRVSAEAVLLSFRCRENDIKAIILLEIKRRIEVSLKILYCFKMHHFKATK